MDERTIDALSGRLLREVARPGSRENPYLPMVAPTSRSALFLS